MLHDGIDSAFSDFPTILISISNPALTNSLLSLRRHVFVVDRNLFTMSPHLLHAGHNENCVSVNQASYTHLDDDDQRDEDDRGKVRLCMMTSAVVVVPIIL